MAWPAMVSAISSSAGTMGPIERAYFGHVDRGQAEQQQRVQEIYELINMWVQQQYAKENAEAEYWYNSQLSCQSARQSEKLAQLQNELSKELNDYNAARDYENTLKYIGDSLTSWRQALVKNGYNPLLALGTSIPSYGSSSHSAVAGMPSVSAPHVSTGHAPGGSAPGSAALANTSSASSLAQSVQAGANLAKLSSEVSRNEAATTKDKALAAEALERAKSEAAHRDPTTGKIDSEKVRNYGSTAASIATGIGTAYGAKKVADKVRDVVHVMKQGRPVGDKVMKPVVESVVEKGTNSGYLGSRLLQSVLPVAGAMGIPGVVGGAAAAAEVSRRHANKNPSSNAARIWSMPNFGSRLR